MKLDKFKPSKQVQDDRLPPQHSTWEKKGDKAMHNIHGINRRIKEGPDMVKTRLEISKSQDDAIRGKRDREDSLSAYIEREGLGGINEAVERARKNVRKKK